MRRGRPIGPTDSFRSGSPPQLRERMPQTTVATPIRPFLYLARQRTSPMRESFKHSGIQADEAWSKVCKALSLPYTAKTWPVDDKIRKLTDAVSKDREVYNLTMRIRAVSEAVERA